MINESAFRNENCLRRCKEDILHFQLSRDHDFNHDTKFGIFTYFHILSSRFGLEESLMFLHIYISTFLPLPLGILKVTPTFEDMRVRSGMVIVWTRLPFTISRISIVSAVKAIT